MTKRKYSVAEIGWETVALIAGMLVSLALISNAIYRLAVDTSYASTAVWCFVLIQNIWNCFLGGAMLVDEWKKQ